MAEESYQQPPQANGKMNFHDAMRIHGIGYNPFQIRESQEYLERVMQKYGLSLNGSRFNIKDVPKLKPVLQGAEDAVFLTHFFGGNYSPEQAVAVITAGAAHANVPLVGVSALDRLAREAGAHGALSLIEPGFNAEPRDIAHLGALVSSFESRYGGNGGFMESYVSGRVKPEDRTLAYVPASAFYAKRHNSEESRGDGYANHDLAVIALRNFLIQTGYIGARSHLQGFHKKRAAQSGKN